MDIIRNTNATESYYWYLIDQVYVVHCLVYINLIDISLKLQCEKIFLFVNHPTLNSN